MATANPFGAPEAEEKAKGPSREDVSRALHHRVRDLYKALADGEEGATRAVLRGVLRLPGYSLANRMALVSQAPHIQLPPRSLRKWNDVDRKVRKGSKGLGIWVPGRALWSVPREQAPRILRRMPAEEAMNRHREAVEGLIERGMRPPREVLADYPDLAGRVPNDARDPRQVFRIAKVFDLGQTEPKEGKGGGRIRVSLPRPLVRKMLDIGNEADDLVRWASSQVAETLRKRGATVERWADARLSRLHHAVLAAIADVESEPLSSLPSWEGVDVDEIRQDLMVLVDTLSPAGANLIPHLFAAACEAEQSLSEQVEEEYRIVTAEEVAELPDDLPDDLEFGPPEEDAPSSEPAERPRLVPVEPEEPPEFGQPDEEPPAENLPADDAGDVPATEQGDEAEQEPVTDGSGWGVVL